MGWPGRIFEVLSRWASGGGPSEVFPKIRLLVKLLGVRSHHDSGCRGKRLFVGGETE